MNDSFSGKNGKVKVMYVRSDDDNRNNNKRSDGKGRPTDNARSGRPGQDKQRGGYRRDADPRRSENDRPRRPARTEDSGGYESPWKTVSRGPDEEPAFDHGGISGKSFIDPEQLRRQRAEETRVYGENACQALFASRPESIVRAWFIQSVTPRFREALRWMAANRKAYHVVDDDELEKASGTEHHGGVCFLIKKRQGLDAQTYLKSAPSKDCVLALEDVGNPHILGAIVRSCANFGVNGVLLQDPALLESGAAVRTAEGGAEHIKAINADDFLSVLDTFRQAGYTIVTASSRKGERAGQAKLPAKAVLVLGSEGSALSDNAWQQGDMSVSIGGTGKVDSLNISVTAGILLADWWRQNHE
ncbi:tRNA/rRNA methyltransferase [Serratia sp. DD3]|uniref:tRNA/rRNA methyltransferase n=1 Tax=Serratia sp. DD3 TaxID=1410619 RepID=UPI0003C4F0DC|nr:tRNA/rRNA methyltransferase [Serratia sp. DD3]KEY56851.1 putative TrmH family tRNA/rRNA methyltransferase [Serratia sp. DD3]